MKQSPRLLLRWAKIFLGRSYYHAPQGEGRAFHPERLAGYFNDLTAKTAWKGLLDDSGIPVVQLIDGSVHHFPTTIIQKALGHYDRFLLEKDYREIEEFIRLCTWIMGSQDARGGWPVQTMLSLKDGLKYSAMPQGEAISACVRAWNYTRDERYLDSAYKAYELMTDPIGKGGTAYYDSRGYLFFEECPSFEKNTILNGWIFALFGSYDFFLATGEESCRKTFERSFHTLRETLHLYDSGRWSFYDERGILASPFYHDLHISQLQALWAVTGDTIIERCLKRWKKYRESAGNRYAAILMKAVQKLRNPAPVVIMR